MLTYLDIIMHHSTTLIGEEATPAGVLYFHVHNPMINAKKILTLEEIEKELFKKFKMNGLVLGEENAIRLMDLNLDTGIIEYYSSRNQKRWNVSQTFQSCKQARV